MGEIPNKMSAVALSLATSALLLIESRKRINFTTETFAHFKFAISDESSTQILVSISNGLFFTICFL